MKQPSIFHGLVCLCVIGLASCTETPAGNGNGGAGGEGGWGSGGNAGQGGAASSSSGSMTTSSSSSSNGSSGSSDPYEGARQACVDKINALRATKGLSPLERWKEAEPCVDQQATYDEMNNKPHGAWGMQLYPTCNGSGQNECLGQGPGGIEGCLDSMWAEKDQAGCSGCDACADAYNPNCPNCDFYGGNTGDVCGHYVNMSAKYFTRVACGFSSLGGWDAINFQ
jgi:Cysteine-rich secretory protein family